jgi:hypothetical protein
MKYRNGGELFKEHQFCNASSILSVNISLYIEEFKGNMLHKFVQSCY